MKICVAAPIATADIEKLTGGTLAGFPQGYSGAPLVAILIGEFLREGHAVHAVTVDYGGQSPSTPKSGTFGRLTYTVLPGRPRAWRPSRHGLGRACDLFRQERRELAQEIRRSGADLVHAHWTYEFALGAIDSGVPHWVTIHDAPLVVLQHSRSVYRALRWLMAQEVFRKAQRFTAVSTYVAREALGAAQDRAVVVANPVSDLAFEWGKDRHANASRAIGMIGNGWGQRKNAHSGLLGFRHYRSTVPEAQLHLFGHDFEPGGAAQAWAGRHGCLDGVHFHGPLRHAQLLQALSELDVLLHPSLEESFGVVLAEAMALGLPVVAGRASGAVPWVVGADALTGQSDCAELVDVADPSAIAGALVRVFDGDYERRSCAGRRRARDGFSAARVAGRYLQLYAGMQGQVRFGSGTIDGRVAPGDAQAGVVEPGVGEGG